MSSDDQVENTETQMLYNVIKYVLQYFDLNPY